MLANYLIGLREGLEEMFTVRRLGINGRLAATLTNTNAIEPMISIAEMTARLRAALAEGRERPAAQAVQDQRELVATQPIHA